MCLNPIHICKSSNDRFSRLCRLKDYHVTPSDDNIVAYDVPCGKCDECLANKRNDIFVRCWHEFNRCNQHALFLTLTYNDFYLPLVEVNKQYPVFIPDDCDPRFYECVIEPQYEMIGVWYKPHVQKYLKSLNEKLIYYIGTNIEKLSRLTTIDGKRCISDEWKNYIIHSERPLKYLLVCERGKADIYVDDKGRTRKGTSRPHYHAILFINDKRLYTHIHYILKLCKELWIYGNSYNIQLGNDCIQEKRDSSSCIQYVTKYVTKDVYEVANNILYMDYMQKKNCKPFILMSNGIGASLLDNYKKLDNVLRDGIPVPLGNHIVTCNVPRYNLEKRLKHRIKGVVNQSKPITTKSELYYDSGHSSPYFFLWEDDIPTENTPFVRTKTIKTNECKSLEISMRNDKANHYANCLQLYQKSNLPSLWQTTETPLSERNYQSDIDLLNSVSSDEIYLFVLNDLYVNEDSSDNPDTLYQTYDLINRIKNTLKILKYRQKQLIYKSKLSSVIINKPELFNNHPL